jgi:hypothetical protein
LVCITALVENLVVICNPNSSATEKMPNSNSSFVLLPDVVSKNVILLVKFMKRVLQGAVELDFFL